MFQKSILVLNCGSSSIKFSIIEHHSSRKLLYGSIESIGLQNSSVTWKIYNLCEKRKIFKNIITHEIGFKFLFHSILSQEQEISNTIIGIGHRIVHGGDKITSSVLLNEVNIKYVKDAICFAPLHNPLNLLGVMFAKQFFSHLSDYNVGVFDTVFHQTLQKEKYLYAIPYQFYSKNKIRRYGAHGISHQFVRDQSSKILNIPICNLNMISCHLGNGASITAIRNGVSVDTSMGLTPLEGLVMGTRSGDIDPAIIFFMYHNLNLKISDIENILIKKSGLLGLNGETSDFQKITDSYATNKQSKLSIDIFCHRLAKYISGYSSLMNGKLDALAFTGGIGENSSLMRKITIDKLSLLGFFIDYVKNDTIYKKKQYFIHTKESIPILVIFAQEEESIAKETFSVIHNI
ncbi:acetate kinase [Buchnera aphidicola (Thelaxes californica)]|uniref:Acetate kinase n=1 Tax=Buchnera aphidicola (Thelaxes californica) TaxID=1315998 RepID=A0A4D6YJL4_9GAMM|nr:acetate kinase [Buchnera aphidicola]QCI26691.1 acetate kinase [Buchnera aphidicola (Thelaxes californica)]